MIGTAPVGALDDSLAHAVRRALTLHPDDCRAHALKFTWRQSARQFLSHLAPIARSAPAPLAFGAWS